jgi:diguanylate cyclase (GGDEF)-like protein/PAS domain S-box-containing protein
MRFKQLVEGANEGILVADAESLALRYVNPAACQMLGYQQEELMGLVLDDIHPAENTTDMRERVRLAAERHAQQFENIPWKRKDGMVFYADINSTAMTIDGRLCVVGFFSDTTERRRVQEALQKSQMLLNEAQEVGHLGNWTLDLCTGQAIWSDEEYRLLGYEPGSVEATVENFMKAVHPDDRQAVAAEMERATHNDDPRPYLVEHRVVLPQGERIVEERGRVTFSQDGTPLRMFGTTLDITQRQLAIREAMQRSSELEAIFQALPDIYFRIARDGTILDYRAQQLTSLYMPPEQFLGHRMQDILPPALGRMFLEKRDAVAHSGQLQTYEYSLEVPDGLRTFEARLTSLAPVSDDLIAVIRDVTERKRVEEEIRYRANYDQLTGLPNRELLVERLTQTIKQSHREPHRLALLFVDLDHFKQVNDTLGHALGDRLLQQAAERLEHCVREIDTVARLGGDEFVVLLQGMDHPRHAAQVAGKIIDLLDDPFQLEGHAAHIGASIGITLFPDDGEDVLTLFRNADLAMYRAKDAGRNTFQFFEASMTQAAMERRNLESDLRKALDHGEFLLHYQPIYDLREGYRLVGAEALVRWQHPQRSLVSPDAFIPLAEETGLIRELGAWVLEQSCRQAGQWMENGLDLYVAVNISSRQIPDALPVEWLQALPARYGLAAHRLVLEITEGILLADTPKTHQWFDAVRDLGFKVSVDDFGTGYSSLAYLKRFQVDTVKIDRTFVGDMERDAADRALVEAILAMARSLGLEVVAEGVESPGQLELLRQMGCRYAQGYHLSRPVTPEALPELARREWRALPTSRAAGPAELNEAC